MASAAATGAAPPSSRVVLVRRKLFDRAGLRRGQPPQACAQSRRHGLTLFAHRFPQGRQIGLAGRASREVLLTVAGLAREEL